MTTKYTRVQASNYPLTLGEFKQILETRLKSEIVGVVGITNSCPIANVLRERNMGAYVGNRRTFIEGDNSSFDNPDWVTKFTIQIDGYKEDYTPITVEEALEVVNSIEE